MYRFSVFLLTMVMTVMPQWVFAADDFKITVMSTSITGSCDTSTYSIVFSWTNSHDDGGNFDLVTMIATDEDARAIASDWTGGSPGDFRERTTVIGNGAEITSIVAGKNITVEVFDSVLPRPPGGYNFQDQYDDIAARPEPAAISLTFNPGNCDQELMVTADAQATAIPSLSRAGLAGLIVTLLLLGGLSVQRRLS